MLGHLHAREFIVSQTDVFLLLSDKESMLFLILSWITTLNLTHFPTSSLFCTVATTAENKPIKTLNHFYLPKTGSVDLDMQKEKVL